MGTKQRFAILYVTADFRPTAEVETMFLSGINKFGLVLFVCGVVALLGLYSINILFGVIGVVAIVTGLLLAIKGRDFAKVSDRSSGHTSADLDADD